MPVKYYSNPNDVKLEADIYRSIHDMGSAMHVSVDGGHVTLSGSAEDFLSKREIVSAVRSMPFVRKITNNIKVAP
jgi:osmotically-inducible protein OsmY